MQTSGSSCLHYFPANAGTCSFSCSTLTWCWEFGQGTTLYSPVRAQQFGMSSELCVLWNRTWFEHRNYTLLLQETILKKYLQCSVFTKHQVKYSFRWFCPCKVLKIKKLNLYLRFWGVGFFFSFSSTKIWIFTSVWYIPELCIQFISLMHEYLWGPHVKAGNKFIISWIVRLTPTL